MIGNPLNNNTLKKGRKGLIILLCAVLGIGAVAGIAYAARATTSSSVLVVQAAGLSYGGGMFEGENSLSGIMTTDAEQVIYLSDTETVEEVMVTAGQSVHVGDVLFTYDTKATALNLEKARIAREKLLLDLEVAQKNLDTLRGMSPTAEEDFGGLDDFGMFDEEITEEDIANLPHYTVLDEKSVPRNMPNAAASSGAGAEGEEDLGFLLGTEDMPYIFLAGGDEVLITDKFIARWQEAAREAEMEQLYIAVERRDENGLLLKAWTQDIMKLDPRFSITLNMDTGETAYAKMDDPEQLAALFADKDPETLAEVLRKLDPDNLRQAAKLLDEQTLASVLNLLQSDSMEKILDGLSDARKQEILDYLRKDEEARREEEEQERARQEEKERQDQEDSEQGKDEGGETTPDSGSGSEGSGSGTDDGGSGTGDGGSGTGDGRSGTGDGGSGTGDGGSGTGDSGSGTQTPSDGGSGDSGSGSGTGDGGSGTGDGGSGTGSSGSSGGTDTPAEGGSGSGSGSGSSTDSGDSGSEPAAPTDNGSGGSGSDPSSDPGAGSGNPPQTGNGSENTQGAGTILYKAGRVDVRLMNAYVFDAGKAGRLIMADNDEGEESTGGGSSSGGASSGYAFIDADSAYTSEDLERARKEEERKIKSLQLDLRESDLKIAQAEKAIEEGSARARMNGVIKTVGDPENPPKDGSAFLRLSSAEGLFVRSALRENMLGTIKIGDTVNVRSWQTGQSYEAEVRDISPYPDETGTFSWGSTDSFYPFTAYISDPDANLQNDEWVDVSYTPSGKGGAGEVPATEEEMYGESGTMYLWKAFIVEENGQYFVYKENENGRLVKQSVKVGAMSGDSYEILDGLAGSDYIAFPYGKNVKEGAKTREGTVDDLYNM